MQLLSKQWFCIVWIRVNVDIHYPSKAQISFDFSQNSCRHECFCMLIRNRESVSMQMCFDHKLTNSCMMIFWQSHPVQKKVFNCSENYLALPVFRWSYHLPSLACTPYQGRIASEQKPTKKNNFIEFAPLLLYVNDTNLVCWKKIEVIWRVGNHISFAGCIWACAVVAEPEQKIFFTFVNFLLRLLIFQAVCCLG